MNIWESFVEFLEDLIRRFGLIKLIFGFTGFASALIGLALGFHLSSEVKIGLAGVFVIVVLLLTCLALIIDRHRLRSRMTEGTDVLNRYGDEIVSRQDSDSFDIKEWRDEQYVDKNGDTTIRRWFTLVVRNQPLQTFWHVMVMDSLQDNINYRKKLTIDAKTFDPNTLEPGVNFLYTRRWEGQHSVRLFVHLDRPYAPGEEVRVLLQVFWPEYLLKLLESKQGDDFEWIFRRKVDQLRVTFVFAKRLGIEDKFATKPFPGSQEPKQTIGPDGTMKVEFEANHPPMNASVGFKIQRTKW
ncbi:hypothetical protein A5646_20510 [Mycobacterium sp. 1245499.0]|uniref:hypothetical protein n=1 Tax=Mycobacterium sp. 1245499.0 TaxID=1834074 RepID=UPI0007FF344F|nr:hypothetical protein [Mycobacterium sp. 1245499.0]OBL00874.1 hypothetical protein A5646_20510 [Mycobacterium sp. 1245499.0]